MGDSDDTYHRRCDCSVECGSVDYDCSVECGSVDYDCGLWSMIMILGWRRKDQGPRERRKGYQATCGEWRRGARPEEGRQLGTLASLAPWLPNRSNRYSVECGLQVSNCTV